MKKLTFYFLISLFFITRVLADQLAVVDIKLETKLTDYFSTAQISKYNTNDEAADLPFYSYDGKYSIIAIEKESNIFKGDYDSLEINYANKNDEIVNISGVIWYQFSHSDGLNECIEYRDQKIYEYKQKAMIIGLEKKTQKKTWEDGMKEDSVFFHGNKFSIAFKCFSYPDLKDVNHFRLSYMERKFNDWLVDKIEKQNN